MSVINERDKDTLAAILDYCDRINNIVERFGKAKGIFLKDADFRDAAMMNIFQMGEASNRLSDECKEILCDIPWHEIYATRNVIAHGYVKVDDEIIWDVIVNDIPKVVKEINDKTGIV